MVVRYHDGYFENGIWNNGLTSDMIGQKIIRRCPCETPYGKDWSYSVEGKLERNLWDNWVYLIEIGNDGGFIIKNQRGYSHFTYESYWNDGNWVLLSDLKKEMNYHG